MKIDWREKRVIIRLLLALNMVAVAIVMLLLDMELLARGYPVNWPVMIMVEIVTVCVVSFVLFTAIKEIEK